MSSQEGSIGITEVWSPDAAGTANWKSVDDTEGVTRGCEKRPELGESDQGAFATVFPGAMKIRGLVDVTGIEPVTPCLQNRFQRQVKLVVSDCF